MKTGPAKPDGKSFTLPSGRVLFLNEPLTAEELEAVNTPEGLQAMEALADQIQERATVQIRSADPQFPALCKSFGVDPENGGAFVLNLKRG